MQAEFSTTPGFSLDVATFGDYFGLWAIESNAFRSLVNGLQGINLHTHVQSAAASNRVREQDRREYEVTSDGVALISITGPTMKSPSSLSSATSTVRVRQQLRAARQDSEVRGALLVMDTPGGTAKGNADLADEVARLALAKPIYVFAEDLVASAGVSVASQATMRFANTASAMYGGMGTFAVLMDSSGMAEKLGVEVHVIRAGEFKGMGEPGTEVTDRQLAEAQRTVNTLNEAYLGLIARGLSKPVEMIRSLADGRLHSAEDAVEMGLIDGVQTYEETYSRLVAAMNPKATKPQSQKGSVAMSDESAATLAELKSTFPNSTAEWRETQLEAGATIQRAAVSYAQHIEEQREAERNQHAEELEKAKAGALSLGHDPVSKTAPDGDDELQETGDPIEDFHSAVSQIAGPNADLRRRQAAVRQIAKRQPELHRAYLLAMNPSQRATRLIKEKLEPATS